MFVHAVYDNRIQPTVSWKSAIKVFIKLGNTFISYKARLSRTKLGLGLGFGLRLGSGLG